jgi:hypothetical protein
MKTKQGISSLAWSVILAIVIMSCAKEEGEGGNSSITGKVFVKDYNSTFTYIHHQYYGQDEDVYIMYGNHNYFDDKTSTSYDGTFHFGNLRKGSYTIFVYSKDTTYYTNPSTNKSELIAEKKVIEITKNNQHIVLDDIIIAN